MPAREIGAADWPRLSPRLDDLLDQPTATQAARLAALRREDAVLADALQALLGRLAGLDDERFLETPALPASDTLAAPAGSAHLAVQTVGAYTLVCELGQGGMGSVWLAQRADGRYDAQLLDTTARVRLMLPVLAAVAHAHSRLILHRDLKLSNILVTAQGQPKLLDFGVGKLLGEHAARGDGLDTRHRATPKDLTGRAGLAFTARCAAPEQLQGLEVTTATDVYALGVLLYGLLGGGHPTEGAGATPLAQWQAVIDAVPRRLSDAVLGRHPPGANAMARLLRGDLDTIVARTLKKNPAERYPRRFALAVFNVQENLIDALLHPRRRHALHQKAAL